MKTRPAGSQPSAAIHATRPRSPPQKSWHPSVRSSTCHRPHWRSPSPSSTPTWRVSSSAPPPPSRSRRTSERWTSLPSLRRVQPDMRRILLAAALTVLALPAAANAQTVATPGAATGVREFAGNLVFSQFDRTANRYFLTVRRAGAAAPERLPVAPSGRPFDADIGSDSSGRPALVYSRCSNPPGVASGCDLFVSSLDGATGERPVRNANDPNHNDTNPTLWRGRIAWARDYGAADAPNPIVYTKA